MTAFRSVPFSRERIEDLLSLVTSNAQSRWPHVSYLLNSDVAWRLPGSAPRENIRLWYDGEGIAAYAWFAPNAPIAFDLRTNIDFDSSIAADVLAWLETRRSEFPAFYPWLLELGSMSEWEDALSENLPGKDYGKTLLMVSALDCDEPRKRFLQRAGFEPTGHFQYSLTRSLSAPIEQPEVPAGYRLRSVDESDFEERVATHRDAWFKSSFTIEQYRRVRSIEIFEPSLDLVAEDATGRFGAYCIGWLDRKLGVGSFEPVGTRPQYRRLGLGKATNLEGLRRMKEMGMHSAKIGTAGFNDPAYGLYCSCGFSLVDKDRTWVKEMARSAVPAS
ncbi:MAG: GNAT family N-acetyltransferase [Pseudomonadota bacterium]